MTDFNDVLDALNYDPLYEAEKITGKSYKEDDTTLAVGLFDHIGNVARKKALLLSRGDTYYGMPYEDLLHIAEKLGFVPILTENFVGRSYSNEPAPNETFTILWNAELGILMTAESYMGKDLNSGSIYYNLKRKNEDSTEIWKYTSSGGMRNGIWVGHHDIREGLKAKIEGMKSVAEFLPVWTERPFLWLMNYMDEKVGDSYKEINEERISRFPEEVQNAIRGNSTN